MTRRERFTPPPDGPNEDSPPKWRQDFPIGWDRDEWVRRRDLVKFMTLTSLAFVGGHLWLLIKERLKTRHAEPEEAAIATVDELPVGQAKVFEYPAGSTPRILVRLTEERFVAYDQQCTHLMCPLIPQPRDGKLHCPCHNGWFDVENGRPLAGPPRRPLPRITLQVLNGTVYATGVEEPFT